MAYKNIINLIILAILLTPLLAAGAEEKTFKVKDFASLDAGVDKIIMSPSGKTGSNITYWIKAENKGKVLLQDVNVTYILPKGLKYIDSNYLNSCEILLPILFEYNRDGTIKKIGWHIGDLDTGQKKWIELKVTTTKNNVDELGYSIHAMGEAFGALINSTSNDLRHRSKQLEAETQGPNIYIKKTYTESNNGIDYSIMVRNNGDTLLGNVTLTDILPESLEFLNATLKFIRNKKEEISDISYKKKSGEGHMNYTWILGDFGIEDKAIINLTVEKLDSNTKPSANKAYAKGDWTNQTVYWTANAEPRLGPEASPE